MFPQNYLNEIETDLKRACWFYGRLKSGKVIRYAGSRRGNRTYAAQTQKRIDVSIDELCKIDGTLLSITLTAPYKYSVKSIFVIFKMVKTRSSVFF
jgi:hypothetical protein